MSIQQIPIESREQWLSERVKDITSTESSALYGLNPYQSEFELYHAKRNKEVVSITENERMTWGKRLESAIAHGAAETMGWDIEKFGVYVRDTDARIGSSFDFKINSTTQGVGIMEVKNVDSLVYHRNWIDDGQGNIEAPEHIEMQIQHQMEVANLDWCALVALVGGNTQKVVLRNRDRNIGGNIRAKVSAFWASVDAVVAPSPDYSKDAEFIIKSLRNSATEGLVVEADAGLEQLIEQFHFVSREGKNLDALKEQYKAQILDRIGEASKVVSNLGIISCGMTKGSEGKIITQEMVGTFAGARSGYRNFRFNQKKEPK